MSQENEHSPSGETLYHSEEYTVYDDRVTQGLYEAAAISPVSMISIYQSPANHRHSRGVMFKFSLNGGDNELPVGTHHYMVLNPKKGMATTPVIRFGETFQDTAEIPENDFLEQNTRFRILLDMNPVLEAFEQQGYFQTHTGERIYKDNFKGVYVAGDVTPLHWNFGSLPDQENLQLHDYDGNGIYETTVILNEYRPEDFKENRWELKEDVSAYPQYSSPHLLIDALYNLSLEETKLDIRPDSTFMAGEKWNGVWTRDISYAILLSLGAIEPEVSKNSLMKKVSRDRIIQDTGTGGSWPVSTDRTTWALAAWEIYKITGDKEWLQQSFEIIRNTVEDDLKVAYNSQTGLFYGESSFLDWREQSYPDWMEPADIFLSQSLGTNAVHYQTYRILGMMADLLGQPSERFKEIAKKTKEGINKHLWVEDKGYYGQFLYGKHYMGLSPKAEALGEALTVLFDIADKERARRVVENTPVVPFGVPSIYPQIPGIPAYHNNGIWPFVQAYWNWTLARSGNEQALLQGMGAFYRSAALFLSNKENMVAENGDFGGTVLNSDRQLWSVAGNLAMVYRVIYGMDYETDGLWFRPFVPHAYAGERTLSNFPYRNARLDIKLEGRGRKVKEAKLDGQPLQITENGVFLPAGTEGKHVLEMVLENEPIENKPFNLVNNHTSVRTPVVEQEGGRLIWQAIKGAVGYQVWKNGQLHDTTTENSYSVEENEFYTAWQVAAADLEGYTSFLSEAVIVTAPGAIQLFEAESFAPKAGLQYEDGREKGFVVLTKDENRQLEIELDIKEAGTYLIDFRYGNGSGPVNTDNKAAIRTLFREGEAVAAMVFPQRGHDAWWDRGYSNAVVTELKEGNNNLSLRFEPQNENMNYQVNKALLDQLRVIRLR